MNHDFGFLKQKFLECNLKHELDTNYLIALQTVYNLIFNKEQMKKNHNNCILFLKSFRATMRKSFKGKVM